MHTSVRRNFAAAISSSNSLLFLSISVCALMAFFASSALADDTSDAPELFITANRSETPARKVGRDIAAVTKEEIDNAQSDNATEALQSVAGVRTVDIGGPGSPGTTPLEIRGVRTGGTQLLYNGLTLSDPSSVSGTYEQYFSFITLEDIERIEVLRGGTSVLYGSDGQGGAINLVPTMPKRGHGASISFQGGSFDTFTEGAMLNYGAERGGLRTTVARVDSGGIDTHGNYENTTVSAIGTVDLIKGSLTLTPIFRLIDAKNDLDTNPALDENGRLIPAQDTQKNNVEATAYIIGATLQANSDSDVENKLNVYYNDSDRNFFFDFDGFESTSKFEGQSFNVDGTSELSLPQLNSKLLGGFEYEHQETDGDGGTQRRDQTALFVNVQSDLLDDLLHISGGGRVTDISNTSKTNTSLEASAALEVPQVDGRVHTSIAQGFRAPTLFESGGTLVDFTTGELVNVGNDTLNPEESLTWDVGYTQNLIGEKLVADVTFFQTDADETIVFDFENETHLNGGSAKTQGIETSLAFKPNEVLTFRAAYTNLDRAEGLDGLRRQRTPRNWYNLSATAKIEALTLFSEVSYRDSQDLEFFGEADRYREADVTTCNVALTYNIIPELQLFVRGENIFDTDYTEAGYNMPGAAVYGGIRATL